MAFGDTVQSVQASASSGNATVTFSSATAGNLLISVWARSNASGGFSIPSGWAAIQSAALAPGPALAGVMLYKIAAGGETSITTEFTADSGNVRAMVAEFAGPFAATPLDQSAEDESNLAATDTSQPSGTTGTTAQNDELAVAAFTADASSNIAAGRAYTNSFTEVLFGSESDAPPRAAVVLAKRVLTTTGAYTTTFSTTGTGDEMWGAIATFKASAAGSTVLVVADATHAHSAEAPSLLQAHLLAVADATHAHAAETVALLQAHLLAVADASHAHAAESPALLQAHLLAVADAAHGHTADNLDLVQAHLLAVADATHAHTADNVSLSGAVLLVVADALHGHTADNVALTQAHLLAVNDALHGHTADNVSLSSAVLLIVADATHAHAADNIALVQDYWLTVADATHAHVSDTVALTQSYVLTVADALHGHTADNVSFAPEVIVDAYGTVLRPNRVGAIIRPDRVGSVSRPNRVGSVISDRQGD